MGLILAAGASLSSVLGDQWKDYFYCSEMPANVLVRKGEHHTGKSGLLNRGGSENIITNGSTVVVNEGQCMIIVDQGAIVDICAEPGAYTYDTSSEPSIFTSGLGKGIKESFKKFAARVAHGGVTAHDQRVYYFNTKNIIGNKYGTASPVPFRVVDRNIGLDLDISIRCFGEYVYKMTDPILFYKNVCGNVDRDYTRDKIEDQLRSELLTALQPAFARISDQGIRYSSLPGHTRELSEALNTELSSTWGQVYGIEIVTCGVSSVKASEEDEQAIKNLQLGLAAGGGHGADHKLTFSTDVEHACLERKGHRQACHDIGYRVDNDVGEALERGNAGDQPPVGCAHGQTHDRKEHRADQEAQQNGKQDVNEAVFRNHIQKAFFLGHFFFPPPAIIRPRSFSLASLPGMEETI